MSCSELGDGEHVFAVRAVDNASNRDPTPETFTWTVVPTIAEVVERVQAFALPNGIERSLVDKLDGAQRARERGNPTAACGKLGEFTNEVKAQSGKAIDPDDAEGLVVDAEGIRRLLGCK